MNDNDQPAAKPLLDELEAIRTLLNPGPAAPATQAPPTAASIPAPATPSALLDLDFIFNDGETASLAVALGEDVAPLFPRFTLAVPDRPHGAPEQTHCPSVENLLRHLLPRIEAALRQHLRTLDALALAEWQTRLE